MKTGRQRERKIGKHVNRKTNKKKKTELYCNLLNVTDCNELEVRNPEGLAAFTATHTNQPKINIRATRPIKKSSMVGRSEGGGCRMARKMVESFECLWMKLDYDELCWFTMAYAGLRWNMIYYEGLCWIMKAYAVLYWPVLN